MLSGGIIDTKQVVRAPMPGDVGGETLPRTVKRKRFELDHFPAQDRHPAARLNTHQCEAYPAEHAAHSQYRRSDGSRYSAGAQRPLVSPCANPARHNLRPRHGKHPCRIMEPLVSAQIKMHELKQFSIQQATYAGSTYAQTSSCR